MNNESDIIRTLLDSQRQLLDELHASMERERKLLLLLKVRTPGLLSTDDTEPGNPFRTAVQRGRYLAAVTVRNPKKAVRMVSRAARPVAERAGSLMRGTKA